MKNIKRTRIILTILIILWTIVVFYFSNQGSNASATSSYNFTSIFIKNEELAQMLEPYFRKIAHYIEYIIGGLLFCALVLTYKLKDERTIIVCVLLGIWYSSLDELHQSFIPGRTGRLVDIYIDTLGVATGTVFLLIINKLINKKRKM